MKHQDIFFADSSYHVFNKANGREKIFIEPDNYDFFLRKFRKYILPIADVYAYILLPNHFHFLLRIKSEETLSRHYKHLHKKLPDITTPNWVNTFVIRQFSNFLNSYAKSFNKKYERSGSLFMNHLKRARVETDRQFTATLFYVHKNAVHHGYVKNIEDWHYSSYKAIISNKPTLLMRDQVIEWFGSVQRYIEYHQQPIYLKDAKIME
ncbi:hypothetical protein [Ferruginibacter sp. HRS2-29]|uniref:hypothetical protein n=1 Tax=Ferruginibacter sp. HRS2-29 TaxID=2487334 RepID=UPI0020CE33F1|nr:hypothetical protein [Ferruginibacter sp. HRS2-29]MCP9751979.1 hypothetical protein [Ferruginibacter sp. HRS2-29]